MNRICDTFIPQIVIQGRVYGIREAANAGFELDQTIEKDGDIIYMQLKLKNHSSENVRLDKFNWHRSGKHCDFLNQAGMKLYLEGWQMASPCGVRQYGDQDYKLSSSYLNYSVAEPEDYSELPNHFRAEHMMMFHGTDREETLLAGFITSDRQFGYFKTELAKDGVEKLDIRCGCDGMLVEPGEEVTSEVLVLMSGKDGFELQCRYASLWGERMHARTHQAPPVGWCSWYYYFSKVTEKDIRQNTEYLSNNRERYPMKYIQLDDGYQSALGDWLSCNEKFPGGLKQVAECILQNDFIPALWLAPFLAEENSVLLKEHPDWMIHDAQGNVILEFNWRTNKAAVLDGTHPEVQAHFKKLFREIRSLGFDYVKLDFMMTACCMRNGVLHDPKATRAQALRRGLAAIREGFGEDGYILGCTVPFGPLVGLVDGERISTDITPYWTPDKPWSDEAPTVPNVGRNVIRHLYMNKRIWNNDPDTLIVRDDNTRLTEQEVLLWYELVRLSGGMLLLSDNFLTLSENRAKLVEALLQDTDAFDTRPVDFWNTEIPSVLSAVHRRTGAKEIGLFNFSDVSREIHGKVVEPHSCGSIVK